MSSIKSLIITAAIATTVTIMSCDKVQSIEPNIYAGCCGISHIEDTLGQKHYVIPNAISPNNDDINDAFSFYCSDEMRILSLSVLASNGSLGINRSNIPVRGWTDIWTPRNSSNIIFNGLFDYTIVLSDLEGTIDTINGQFCSISCLDEDSEEIPREDCRFRSQADERGSFISVLPDSMACF